jgi:hypothetical protein
MDQLIMFAVREYVMRSSAPMSEVTTTPRI